MSRHTDTLAEKAAEKAASTPPPGLLYPGSTHCHTFDVGPNLGNALIMLIEHYFHNHHPDPDPSFEERIMASFEEVISNLDSLTTKVETMSTNIVTIQDKINELQGNINSGNFTSEQEDQFQAKIVTLTEKLDALKASADAVLEDVNPTPPPPPPPDPDPNPVPEPDPNAPQGFRRGR